MKILEVCSFLGSKNTGAEVFGLGLSEVLADKGIHVELASSFEDYELFQKQHPFYKNIHEINYQGDLLKRKFFRDYWGGNGSQLRKIVLDNDIDIVHINSFYGIGSDSVRAISDITNVFITAHDTWMARYNPLLTGMKRNSISEFIGSVLTPIHRSLNQSNLRGSTIVSPSKYLQDLLINDGFERVENIPNGVDFNKYQLNLKKKKNILYVGRLSRIKGLGSVIGKLEEFAQNNGYKVQVLGDGEIREELEAQYPTVEFLGFIEPSDYYNTASIHIVPSHYHENFPYVVLEGQYNGCLVIAHSVGGMIEMIDDGENGYKYKTQEELEIILSEIETDTLKTDSIRRKAHEDSSFYTWENCSSEYLKMFEEAING